MISLVAAIGKNNELGKNGGLVWKLPADMRHFVEATMGHGVIMGRKTFESIGRALPKRRNIVITRDINYKKENIEVVHSLEEALALFPDKKEIICIIGGAEIFKEAMSVADKLDITHIQAEDKNADTFFPEIIPIVWNEISHEEHQLDGENPLAYTFSTYVRI